VAVVLFSVVSKQSFKRIRPVFRETAVLQAEVSGRLTESISGIRVVKGYHAEASEARVFSAGVERMQAVAIRTMRAVSIMGISVRWC